MSVTPVANGNVTVEVDGRIVTVTFNRPEKRNAITQEMYRTMADTLEAADADLDVAAVVFTGNGEAFTAGNDLQDFASGGSLEQVSRFLQALITVQVPLIAAVNGMAIGVGLTMLLHCDLVYVEPSAVLSAPFVALGLVPEAASSLILPRVVGERRAAEILLAGRKISGNEAAEWGLANAVASPVLKVAGETARSLAEQPPQAVRTTKALLRSDELTIAGRMAEEMTRFVEALGGAEFAEVMAARSEKRPPVF
ncbi:MAG TPA: enoyl-CoA hydratase-related protein [Acidimicrobiales bacterium]|jgi:enoyl-CoA hydratase/carnithine racemase